MLHLKIQRSAPLAPQLSKTSRLALLLTLGAWLASCGKNTFTGLEAQDPKEEAVKYMEAYKPSKAITTLLKALGSELRSVYDEMPNLSPEEISTKMHAVISKLKAQGKKHVPAMISILASAHGQLYGIDPFSLALALAAGSTTNLYATDALALGTTSTSALAALYPVLPAATEDNRAGLNQTLAILNALDTADLIPADNFKKSLFFMANASLLTKSLDTNLDGEISADEALTLDINAAADIFNLMTLALEAVSGSDEEGNSAVAAQCAASITQLKEKLETMEGSDDTEKARNFVIAQTAKKSP